MKQEINYVISSWPRKFDTKNWRAPRVGCPSWFSRLTYSCLIAVGLARQVESFPSCNEVSRRISTSQTLQLCNYNYSCCCNYVIRWIHIIPYNILANKENLIIMWMQQSLNLLFDTTIPLSLALCAFGHDSKPSKIYTGDFNSASIWESLEYCSIDLHDGQNDLKGSQPGFWSRGQLWCYRYVHPPNLAYTFSPDSAAFNIIVWKGGNRFKVFQ